MSENISHGDSGSADATQSSGDATQTSASGQGSGRGRRGGGRTADTPDRVHIKRMGLIWLIWMAISEPGLYFGVYPYFPPFRLTDTAHGDQWDALVATMIADGAIAAVLIYGVYALVNWRQRNQPPGDGPPLRSHFRIQAGWVIVSTLVVLGAFIFGTYELIVPAGAGSGEGPSPIWLPGNGKNILPIQVIGQQWHWTYRYPTFGGFETSQLMIPTNTKVAFHVTSLDVIHDWWAYQLGVKADANPGVDNVAFAQTTGNTGKVTVRCDELCGIWHGAMFGYGYVVPKAKFMKWGHMMAKKLKTLTSNLPKFSWVYYPSANGDFPGPPYYPPNTDPFYKMYQYQYGKSGSEGGLPPVSPNKSGG